MALLRPRLGAPPAPLAHARACYQPPPSPKRPTGAGLAAPGAAHARWHWPCAGPARGQPSVRRVAAGGDPGLIVDVADPPSVEELMCPDVLTLAPDTPVREAARSLLAAGVSGAPVVDADGRLVGVLSEGDLLFKETGPSDHYIIPPTWVGALDALISLRDTAAVKKDVDRLLARTVGEAMTKTDLATVAPTDDVRVAASRMLGRKVGRLPVVEADGRVVGLITRSDVLLGMMGSSLL